MYDTTSENHDKLTEVTENQTFKKLVIYYEDPNELNSDISILPPQLSLRYLKENDTKLRDFLEKEYPSVKLNVSNEIKTPKKEKLDERPLKRCRQRLEATCVVENTTE